MKENDMKLDRHTIGIVVGKLSDTITLSLDWLVETGDAQSDEDFNNMILSMEKDFYFAIDLIKTLHNK